jgi:hypothetical protein
MNKPEETGTFRQTFDATAADKPRPPLAMRLQWLSGVQEQLAAADDETQVLDIARKAAWRLGQGHGIVLARRGHSPCRLLPAAGGDLPCPQLDPPCAKTMHDGRTLTVDSGAGNWQLPDPLRSLMLVPAGRAGSYAVGICWQWPGPIADDDRALLEILCRSIATTLEQFNIETYRRMTDQRFRVLV